MKRGRFILEKYFDKYNDLKQKTAIILKYINGLYAKVINTNPRPGNRIPSRLNRLL